MDDSNDTLGMQSGPVDPDDLGPLTGMESTVSADSDEMMAWSRGARPVDLSFLAPSARAGSIGRLGDYEVIGVIGRGAVGIVLKALDRGLGRFVALKVQDPALALNLGVRAHFLREGRAMATISDPHVVTIYKVIVRDRPYLVMEYLPGSLRDRIKDGPTMGVPEALRIGVRVARGLAAAHARGVLHRDVKPANILLDLAAGRVKLTDFGLAVAGEDGLATASAEPNRTAGTPGYMSPEQVRGEALDARSDLFGLGCVLHALFAGRSPFHREKPEEILPATCEDAPEPTPVPPGCPIGARLARLIAGLLAKARCGRPDSAERVADELQALLDEAEAADETAPAAVEAGPAPEPDTAPIAIDPKRGFMAPAIEPEMPAIAARRPSPRPWAAVALVACLLVALAWLLLANWPRREGRGVPQELAWTVGRTPGADFPDLPSALAKVPRGARLLLVDDGDYRGPFVLDDPVRFEGLVIEARGRARLVAPRGAESVVAIRGVPGVVLRGLEIAPRLNQFAVKITGAAEGVTLDRVTARSPKESKWTQVYIVDGASGSRERPIVVKDSHFEVGQGGVTVQGKQGSPVKHVTLEGNRFRGENEQVHILQAVECVTVIRNVFIGGQALTLNFLEWGARNVTVANNSFFRARTWLHPADSHPNQEDVLVCNNAIFECDDIDAGNQALARMARGKWLFRSNLWEPGPEAIAPNAGPLAEPRPKLDVESRDPVRPEFLRPSSGSELARKGVGAPHPPHVGALPPRIQPPIEPSTSGRPVSPRG